MSSSNAYVLAHTLRSSQRGFTLVELMIVIAIAAILAAIALPQMNTFIQNNRLVSQVNMLIVTLNEARSSAVTRGRQVVVCGSANGQECDGNWTAGWISFLDVNQNDDYDLPSDPPTPENDILLMFMNDAPAGVSVRLDNADPIFFDAQGALIDENGDPAAGIFTICDERGDPSARGVIVDPTGRSRAAEDTDAPPNGIRDDAANNDLNC